MAFAAEMWIEAFENTLFIGLGRQRKISKSLFLSERSGTSICNVVLPKVLRSGGDK